MEVSTLLRSMTGYGRGETVRDGMRLTVEMKAVNHRFGEIIVRLPKGWGALEDRVKKLVLARVHRGRVEVTAAVERDATQATAVQIDWQLADQYVQTMRELQARLGLPEAVSARDVLTLPGVLLATEKVPDALDEVEQWLLPAVEAACAELAAMRLAEGERLQADLTSRLQLIQQWTEQIRQLAPEAATDFRQRLQQRLAQIRAESPFEIDPQRLAQEVVLFAERSDISEETTRLQSHCTQFSEQLGKEEPVGRKLDFLLQEMNREANTIASKANCLPIQRLAVEIKTELEKMREQVQNIE